jgi:hypothetical protein
VPTRTEHRCDTAPLLAYAARHEHPEGIVLTREDAATLGIEIDD